MKRLLWVLIFAFAVTLIVRLWLRYRTRGFSAIQEPSSVEAVLARSARRLAMPAAAKALPNPIASSPQVLAEGRAHWADHCAICHGNDGSGDTDMGRRMYPRAPDMRGIQTQQRTDGEL